MTTSDIAVSSQPIIENEKAASGRGAVRIQDLEIESHPCSDAEGVDVTIEGRHDSDAIGELDEAEAEGHEWLRAAIIARRRMADDGERPQDSLGLSRTELRLLPPQFRHTALVPMESSPQAPHLLPSSLKPSGLSIGSADQALADRGEGTVSSNAHREALGSGT